MHMKKFYRNLGLIFLSALTAACTCAAFSACSKKDDNDNSGAGDYVEIPAESVAGKWDEYNGVKLAFVDEEAYNDGEIDESKVLPELNCKLGEKYYMVVDFDIRAPYDNDGRESVTAEVKIQPAAAVSATIQETNSGKVSEETNGDIREIKANYKIPEKADSPRNMRLVIQLEALERNLASVDVSFECTGNFQAVKTSEIEKSAVIGYTEELEYKLENDSYTITGVSDVTVKHLVIPSIINNRRITDIKEYAFNDLQDIEIIAISSCIKNIGKRAFLGNNGVSSLDTIEVDVKNTVYKSIDNCLLSIDGKQLILGCKNSIIPDTVTSIEDCAFHTCNGLKDIVIPDSVSSIGNSAFLNCEIENAVIPAVACKFIKNNNLKTVEITSGESIGYEALSECKNLSLVTMADSVISIGEKAFYESNITEINLSNNLQTIDKWAFYSCGLKDIIIPNSVTNIGASAFNSSGIVNITLSENITEIKDYTFSRCYALKNIVIPNSVNSIGAHAFDTSGLIEITLSDSLNKIGTYAFYNCDDIRNITIPDSVTYIASEAFKSCYFYNVNAPALACYYLPKNSSLKTVNITSGRSLTSFALSGCSGITSITISDSVTSIGDYAFRNCSRLTSILIPDSVTDLGWGIFTGCENLKKVSIPYLYRKEQGHFGRFFGASTYTDNANYVPPSVEEVVITNETIIGENAFYGCNGLTSISIPDSVTNIGYQAFYGCYNLRYYEYEGCRYLGNKQNNYVVLMNVIDENITSCKINNNTKIIYDCAFTHKDLLSSIVIPNSVTSIGRRAFSGCSGLTSVIIPDGLTSIEPQTFECCDGLKSITIPKDVTSIGYWAFSHCSGLTVVTFSGTQDQWIEIEKGQSWDYDTGNYTVHCTDGDLTKAES